MTPTSTLVATGLLLLAVVFPVAAQNAVKQEAGEENRNKTGAAALDDLKFGNSDSEKSHALVGEKTRIEIGGLGERCRRIEPGGSLVFDLRCDSQQQNYLTIKLWGSDAQVCTIFLASETKRYGRYGDSTPELDLCQGGPAFPGRFYYATWRVPKDLTAGKQRVRLTLVAIGAINPYAPKDQVERPLQGPSRGIYRAYLDTDPFFVPGADETQGMAPTAAEPRRPMPRSAMAEANREQIDDAVAKLLKSQLYGPEWDARVAANKSMMVATGALIRGSLPRSSEDFLDDLMARTTDANCKTLGIIGVYARAYHMNGSRHYQNPELLDRVAEALDFYVVAQGRNGGFTARQWVGGPARADAGGFIEGDGTRWLGRAFLELAHELSSRGLLDENIDHDNDRTTASIARREAYSQMFSRHRDYLVSPAGRGHATNQDLFQLLAMWVSNESLRLLAPTKAWPRERALEYVYQGVGLDHDPLGGYWLSNKGLPLEPWGTLGGGYCGNYGLMCVRLVSEMAELTSDQRVAQQARKAVSAGSHFYYPDTDAVGLPCFRKEGIVSTRNTKWPCVIDYGIDEYAAAELGSPEAERAFQLWLADGNQPEPLNERGDFVSEAAHRIFAAERFEKLLALPVSSVRLFAEAGQGDSAWADEQGSVVAARHHDARLYVSLNWRRGSGQKRDPQHTRVNNIARIHFTTPTIDRIATVAMDSPEGFGKLYICRYGDYVIGMNLTSDTRYTLPAIPRADKAVDLISGRSVNVGQPVPLPPSSSVVLYVSRAAQ